MRLPSCKMAVTKGRAADTGCCGGFSAARGAKESDAVRQRTETIKTMQVGGPIFNGQPFEPRPVTDMTGTARKKLCGLRKKLSSHAGGPTLRLDVQFRLLTRGEDLQREVLFEILGELRSIAEADDDEIETRTDPTVVVVLAAGLNEIGWGF